MTQVLTVMLKPAELLAMGLWPEPIGLDRQHD